MTRSTFDDRDLDTHDTVTATDREEARSETHRSGADTRTAAEHAKPTPADLDGLVW